MNTSFSLQEYDANVVITTPSVSYRIKLTPHAEKQYGKKDILISNPSEWPSRYKIEAIHEPMVRGTIIAPQEYQKEISSLCNECRGDQLNVNYIDQHRMKMEYMLPMNEIVTDFFDDLKRTTSGYGSFDYEAAGFQEGPMHKINILLNSIPVEELSVIIHARKARYV